MREFKLFSGGEFVDAASGETFDTHSPSTNEPIAAVALGAAEDMDRAIAAARKAFDEGPWPGMTPAERTAAMMRVLDGILARQDELVEWETLDSGHTMRMSSLFTVPFGNEYWRHLAQLGGRYQYRQPVEPFGFPVESWDFVEREPFGVCGAIIPW